MYNTIAATKSINGAQNLAICWNTSMTLDRTQYLTKCNLNDYIQNISATLVQGGIPWFIPWKNCMVGLGLGYILSTLSNSSCLKNLVLKNIFVNFESFKKHKKYLCTFLHKTRQYRHCLNWWSFCRIASKGKLPNRMRKRRIEISSCSKSWFRIICNM